MPSYFNEIGGNLMFKDNKEDLKLYRKEVKRLTIENGYLKDQINILSKYKDEYKQLIEDMNKMKKEYKYKLDKFIELKDAYESLLESYKDSLN